MIELLLKHCVHFACKMVINHVLRSLIMANKEQILDKVARNMKQRGHVAVRVAQTVEVTKTGGDILTVSYVDASIQSPMGGVVDTSSPFLGIGIANPGKIKIKGEAGENTIAAIMDTVQAVALMHEVAGYANDIIIEAGDTSAELAHIHGHAHLVGMGS
jgi:hypothetical protein